VIPDVSVPRSGAGVDREVLMPREYSDLYLGVDCVPMPAMPPSDSRPPSPHEIIPMLIGSTVEAIERELVLQTLARCHGNRTHAARLLGLSVRTMRNKIRQYGTDGTEVPGHN
jgi:DNA-binding NtrC family response regulator